MNAKSDAGDRHSRCPLGMSGHVSSNPASDNQGLRASAAPQLKGVSSWK